MRTSLILGGSTFCVLLLLSQSSARAHIRMEGVLKSRTPDGLLPGLDDAQKMSPCDGPRSGGPVYTFQPGTTITLAVEETIPHPSYYRIAFDNDGEDGFKEPKSIKPIVASRACPYDKDDQCGESDFCNVNDPNGARVLWDNLDPHASGGGTYSWNVTLPDIECENCTIQVIQVMEDTVHGAYCPQGSCANAAASLEDIYHRCINIKLQRGATNSPGVATSMTPPKAPAIDCSKQAGAGPGTGSSDAGVADAGMMGTHVDASTGTPDAGSPVAVPGGAMTGGTTPPAGGTTGAGGVTGAGGAVGGVGGTSGTVTSPATGATGGTGGVVPAGSAGGTSGPAPLAPAASEDDGGGCSLAAGRQSATHTGIMLSLLTLTLLRRRRQHKGSRAI